MYDWLLIFVKCFAAIFVVLDAIGNIPMFYALNKRYSEKVKHKNIRIAILIATAILLPFLFFGMYILGFFGVTISGFKIAGGIILFLIGLKVVLGINSSDGEKYSDVSIVPMATPLIAGPGTITTVMILSGIYGYIIPFTALMANLAINFVMLSYSDKLINLLGKQGSEVISKILGMILVAISVEMVISGLGGFLVPGLITLK